MQHILAQIHQALNPTYSPNEIRGLTQLLIRELLNLNPLDQYTGKEIALSDASKEALLQALLRLQEQEPIQYILQQAAFYGSSFYVDPSVLIPRPETEELVELILKENPNATSILDIGTGSGCIAISLAKALPKATVSAWDLSKEALSVAQRNAQAHQVNIELKEQNLFSMVPTAARWDVIVSNPPYITVSEKATIHPNVLDFEPPLALFVPNEDPLICYRAIAQFAFQTLSTDGRLYFEINRAYGNQCVELLDNLGFKDPLVTRDLCGNDRMVSAKR